MNRIILACIALALPSFAVAEAIPATPSGYCAGSNGACGTGAYPTQNQACAALGGTTSYRTDTSQPGCYYSVWRVSDVYVAMSACPATGGWALSGATCYRPDCLNWQVRQADGACGNPSCGGCAVFNTTTHLCDNTCFLPSRCITVEGGTQCSTPDGVCRLR